LLKRAILMALLILTLSGCQLRPLSKAEIEEIQSYLLIQFDQTELFVQQGQPIDYQIMVRAATGKVSYPTDDIDTSMLGTHDVVFVVSDVDHPSVKKEFPVTIEVVAVKDYQAPVLSGYFPSYEVLIGDTSFDPRDGVSAIDDVDGTVDIIFEHGDDYDLETEGKYTGYLIARDKSGHETKVRITINVVRTSDKIPPVINGVRDQTIKVGTYWDPLNGVTCTDNLDGTLTVTVLGVYDVNTVGTYIITYKGTDSAQNETTVSMTLTVSQDDPTIAVNGTYDTIMATDAINAINAQRTAAGLTPFIISENLTAYANVRAVELSYSYSPVRPNGEQYNSLNKDIIKAEFYVRSFTNVEVAMESINNNPVTTSYLMSTEFTHIGVSVYKDADGEIYWEFLLGNETTTPTP